MFITKLHARGCAGLLTATTLALSRTDAIEGERLHVHSFYTYQPVFRGEAEALGQAGAFCEASEVGAPLQPLLSENLLERSKDTPETYSAAPKQTVQQEIEAA